MEKHIKDGSLLTTEEFFKKYSDNTSLSEGHYDYLVEKDSFREAMIEFAKLHVEAALKEALESIPCLGSSSDNLHPWFHPPATYEEVEDAVLNAYPLTLIK